MGVLRIGGCFEVTVECFGRGKEDEVIEFIESLSVFRVRKRCSRLYVGFVAYDRVVGGRFGR